MPFNVLPFSVMPQFRAMPVCEMTIYRMGLLPFSMFNLEEKLSIEFCHGYTSIWNLASALSKSDQLFLIRCLPQKENAKYPHSTRTLSESTHINKNSVFFTKRSASLKCTPWPRLSPKPREILSEDRRDEYFTGFQVTAKYENVFEDRFHFSATYLAKPRF